MGRVIVVAVLAALIWCACALVVAVFALGGGRRGERGVVHGVLLFGFAASCLACAPVVVLVMGHPVPLFGFVAAAFLAAAGVFPGAAIIVGLGGAWGLVAMKRISAK